MWWRSRAWSSLPRPLYAFCACRRTPTLPIPYSLFPHLCESFFSFASLHASQLYQGWQWEAVIGNWWYTYVGQNFVSIYSIFSPFIYTLYPRSGPPHTSVCGGVLPKGVVRAKISGRWHNLFYVALYCTCCGYANISHRAIPLDVTGLEPDRKGWVTWYWAGTLVVSPGGSHKKWARAVDPYCNFLGKQKMTH